MRTFVKDAADDDRHVLCLICAITLLQMPMQAYTLAWHLLVPSMLIAQVIVMNLSIACAFGLCARVSSRAWFQQHRTRILSSGFVLFWALQLECNRRLLPFCVKHALGAQLLAVGVTVELLKLSLLGDREQTQLGLKTGLAADVTALVLVVATHAVGASFILSSSEVLHHRDLFILMLLLPILLRTVVRLDHRDHHVEVSQPRSDHLQSFPLRFTDDTLEANFSASTFQNSFVPFVLFFGLFSLGWLAIALAYPDFRDFGLLGAGVTGSWIPVRAVFTRMADQQRARVLMARVINFPISIAIIGSTALRFFNPMPPDPPEVLVVVAVLYFSCPIYMRLTALPAAYNSYYLVQTTLGLSAWGAMPLFGRPCWSQFGEPGSTIVAISTIYLGEIIGYHLERRMRLAHLHSVISPTTSNAVGGALDSAATNHKDRSTGLSISFFRAHFNDKELEETFVLEEFEASAAPFLGFCVFIVASAPFLKVTFPNVPDVGTAVAAATMGTMILVRFVLHRMKNQSRARVICGRALNMVNLLGHCVILVMVDDQEVSGPGLVAITSLIYAVIAFYLGLAAITNAHRVAFLATSSLGFASMPRCSTLSREVEIACVCGGLLLGWVLGFTLEVHRRRIRLIYHERTLRERESSAETAGRVTEEVANYVFHELRNDMNAAVGVLELLVESMADGTAKLPPKLEGLIHASRVHARHGVKVINGLLDYSKLRAGKLTMKNQTFGLRALVDEAVLMTQHLLYDKPEVSVVVDISAELRLNGPAFYLQQVVLNLLLNACKHTKRGKITATVDHVRSHAQSDMWPYGAKTLTVRVTDSGPGIPLERRALVCEEWHGGHAQHQGNRLSDVRAGSGLGLPLCCSLLRQMGAELTLSSRLDGCAGTVCSFELTLADAPPQESGDGSSPTACNAEVDSFEAVLTSCASSTAATNAPAPDSLDGVRVLLADDQRINRSLFKMQLQKIFPRLEAVEVESGETALATLTARNSCGFDIAFLDEIYGRDLMVGLEVTRRLRALGVSSRRGKPLPIVGITGSTGEHHNRAALEAGQDLVWGKPIPQLHEMREQLSKLMNNTQP